MASIENMTDEELLSMNMPGERGYVMPALQDPLLQKRGDVIEDDINPDNILAKSMEAEPVYQIGEPDIEDGFVDRVVRGAERVGSGAKGVYRGLDALATDIMQFPVKYAQDPLGEGAKIEQEAVELAKGVLAGDPEAQEKALIATSMSMVEPMATGADVELARRDVRKAIETRDPGDIAIAGISTVFAAIPLVGVGLTKSITKAAPDAPEPVFESVLEKAVVEKMPNKVAVDDVEKFLNKKGATKSEITDTKVPEFVEQAKAAGKKSVTKDELIKHLDENKVQIDEVRLGGKGIPLDPERFVAAELESSKAHSAIEPLFLDLAFDSASDSFTSFRTGFETTLLHQMKDDPYGIYDVIDGSIAARAELLENGTGRILERFAGGVNNKRFPYDRMSLARPDFTSYEQMTSRELASMINTTGRGASHQVPFFSNSDNIQVVDRNVLMETVRRFDEREIRNPTGFHQSGPDRMIDRHNRYRENLRLGFESYEKGEFRFEPINNMLHVQDATFLDEMNDDFFAFNDIGIHPNLEDLITPETVKVYRDRLADMTKRYSTGKGSDTKDGRLLVENIAELDNTLAQMQRPGGILDQRALFIEFTESPEFKRLVESKQELIEASEGMIGKPAQYENYTLPGGDNYQEILLTVADTPKKVRLEAEYERISDEMTDVALEQNMSLLSSDPMTPEMAALSEQRNLIGGKLAAVDQEPFTESHFREVPNIMAHIRTKDRVDSEGRKILFVEEIQSDWHQKGLKQGYRKEFRPLNKDDIEIKRVSPEEYYGEKYPLDEGVHHQEWEQQVYRKEKGIDPSEPITIYRVKGERDFSSKLDPSISDQAIIEEINNASRRDWNANYDREVPDAPLKDTKEWTALAIKRIFREAADKGYDGVAFTRGEDIAGVVGGVEEGQNYFYDKLLPSIAKKESKAPLEKGIFPDLSGVQRFERAFPTPDGIDIESHEENFTGAVYNMFLMTPKVKEKVSKPQKLYEAVIGAGAGGAAARFMREDEAEDDS